jgi:transketolase C-terminal domain/subunit
VKNVAVPSGFAVEGLGFFHISHENLVKHRIETRSAVISVTDSVLSIQNVITELQKLIHVGWVRNVEEVGEQRHSVVGYKASCADDARPQPHSSPLTLSQ